MTWKTHSQGIPFSTTLIMPIVIQQIGGMGMSTLDYTISILIAWILVYICARQGSIFPDLDHHEGSIPQKSALNITINKFLHFLFRGKMKLSHRSWQTHSMDLYVIFCGIPSYFFYCKYLEQGNLLYYFASIMILSFMIGGIVHCFMDCFTTHGVWVSIILAFILSLGKRSGAYKNYRTRLAPTWFWYVKWKRLDSRGRCTIIPRPYKYYPITNTNTGGDYEDSFRQIVIHFNKIFLWITIAVYVKNVILPTLNLYVQFL